MSDKNADDKKDKTKPSAETEASAKSLDHEGEHDQVEQLEQPTHGDAKITLPVYLKQVGIKPDQSAGFEVFAHAQREHSNTVAAWQKLHDTFNKRPV